MDMDRKSQNFHSFWILAGFSGEIESRNREERTREVRPR